MTTPKHRVTWSNHVFSDEPSRASGKHRAPIGRHRRNIGRYSK